MPLPLRITSPSFLACYLGLLSSRLLIFATSHIFLLTGTLGRLSNSILRERGVYLLFLQSIGAGRVYPLQDFRTCRHSKTALVCYLCNFLNSVSGSWCYYEGVLCHEKILRRMKIPVKNEEINITNGRNICKIALLQNGLIFHRTMLFLLYSCELISLKKNSNKRIIFKIIL